MALLAVAAVFTGAPRAAAEDPLRTFRPERRAGERALEGALLESVQAKSLRAFHDLCAKEPHAAGTTGDERLVDALARTHRELGLEVETQEVWVYLPRPVRGGAGAPRSRPPPPAPQGRRSPRGPLERPPRDRLRLERVERQR